MLNKEGNLYIFIFSTILVVVMGTGLAFINQITRPAQEKNEILEKKQNILSSIGLKLSREEAGEKFNSIIKSAVAVDKNGHILTDNLNEVFSINLADELKKPEEQQRFPIFIAELNGKTKYIVSMRGKGLWDAIWGFVAVEEDGKTIYGATFDHKSETPGLGAEIKEEPFQRQFVGKIFADETGNFLSIAVIKKGSSEKTDYNVDGISGGTLTSNGVNDMLKKYLSAFYSYHKNLLVSNKETVELESVEPSQELDSLQINAEKTETLKTHIQ